VQLERLLRAEVAGLDDRLGHTASFLRASRYLLDLLDPAAREGTRRQRRERRESSDLAHVSRHTWAAAVRVLEEHPFASLSIGRLTADPTPAWAVLAGTFRILGDRCPPDQLSRFTVLFYEAAVEVQRAQAQVKGRDTQARRAQDQSAARAALVEAARRVVAEVRAEHARKPKSTRAKFAVDRLVKDAQRPGARHPSYSGAPASFIKFCNRNGIEI
jgi:hypothetical protein